jgi:hypothetical protein
MMLLVSIVCASFYLGILFSQNNRLKNHSSKLARERAGLLEDAEQLAGAVDHCLDELNLCAGDVDMLQGLSEYHLTPKGAYVEGYETVEKLEKTIAEQVQEKGVLQAEIEEIAKQIWRPAHKTRQFWKEFRAKLSKKRKLDRQLRRLEKKREKAVADMNRNAYEKRVQVKELIDQKNVARREVAKELSSARGTWNMNSGLILNSDDTKVGVLGDNGEKPEKHNLAAVMP